MSDRTTADEFLLHASPQFELFVFDVVEQTLEVARLFEVSHQLPSDDAGT